MLKARFGRKDRLIKQKRGDAYQETSNLPEPTVCTKCKALFVGGRWTWKAPPENTKQTICPACRRISDNYPAGIITIKGQFFHEHKDNILNLIKNVEKQEKSERPLERIMKITHEKDQTLVTTTGVHIARRIGEAISKSYKGNLSFHYADADKSIRLSWER